MASTFGAYGSVQEDTARSFRDSHKIDRLTLGVFRDILENSRYNLSLGKPRGLAFSNPLRMSLRITVNESGVSAALFTNLAVPEVNTSVFFSQSALS